METNLKLVSEKIHSRCSSLAYLAIAVKRIDSQQHIKYQKLNATQGESDQPYEMYNA